MDPELLGALLLVPYNFVPVDHAACNGTLLPAKYGYDGLYALIGNQFGGSRDQFALPNLQQHEPIAGLTYVIATRGETP